SYFKRIPAKRIPWFTFLGISKVKFLPYRHIACYLKRTRRNSFGYLAIDLRSTGRLSTPFLLAPERQWLRPGVPMRRRLPKIWEFREFLESKNSMRWNKLLWILIPCFHKNIQAWIKQSLKSILSRNPFWKSRILPHTTSKRDWRQAMMKWDTS